MKKFLLIVPIVFFSCVSGTKEKSNTPTFGIVIHGGAGTILRKNMTAEMEVAYRNRLEEAIRVGHAILKNGGTSQEAVEKTIHIMEDSPLFNAGKGAVLTAAETIELDASFMNGKTLDAGAVAGIKTVKNPISAAIKVMENSPHVMLSGAGADLFAAEQGLEIVAPDYFFTERRKQSLKKVKEQEAKANDTSAERTPQEALFFTATTIRHSGVRGLGPRGKLSRRHLHGRHDQQKMESHRGCAHHRSGNLCQ